MFSILASEQIAPVKGSNRYLRWCNVSYYKSPEVLNNVNFDGLDFPLNMHNLTKQMEVFHRNNT